MGKRITDKMADPHTVEAALSKVGTFTVVALPLLPLPEVKGTMVVTVGKRRRKRKKEGS